MRANGSLCGAWELYEEEAGTKVRRTRFRLPNLRFSETPEQSRALNDRTSGAIIIAGSVAAQVHMIGGLSAHADQKGLLQWLAHFRGKLPVVLVHGENGMALGEQGWPPVAFADGAGAVDPGGIAKPRNQQT